MVVSERLRITGRGKDSWQMDERFPDLLESGEFLVSYHLPGRRRRPGEGRRDGRAGRAGAGRGPISGRGHVSAAPGGPSDRA